MQSDIKQYSTLFLRFLDSKTLFMEWGRGVGIERHPVQGGKDAVRSSGRASNSLEQQGVKTLVRKS